MLLLPMFLRSTNRKKDGKNHGYFSVVENRRLPGDKSVQRTVRYLGEINDQQQAAWRKTLDVFDEDEQCYPCAPLAGRPSAATHPRPANPAQPGLHNWRKPLMVGLCL
jgi:hypothetical protein